MAHQKQLKEGWKKKMRTCIPMTKKCQTRCRCEEEEEVLGVDSIWVAAICEEMSWVMRNPFLKAKMSLECLFPHAD
jgi:hypothetical protein